jgi:hypothetical protein
MTSLVLIAHVVVFVGIINQVASADILITVAN